MRSRLRLDAHLVAQCGPHPVTRTLLTARISGAIMASKAGEGKGIYKVGAEHEASCKDHL